MDEFSHLTLPALWGGLGAFIWAGPEWLACAFAGKGGAPLRCSIELAIRLLIGGICAAAFTALALDVFAQDAERMHAVAAVIGLIANTAAPKVVATLSERLARIAKGPGQ